MGTSYSQKTWNERKRSRNDIARHLNEERDGLYRLRVEELKTKRPRKRLRPTDLQNLSPEEMDELADE